MSRHYLDSCSVCDGYCLYAKFARRDIVLTSVHNESNSQINEFDCPNQFSQQPPFASPNYHSHYIPQILNGPRHPHANRPDQYPCINGPDQPPQITEINNINNDFRPKLLNSTPSTPVQTNIQINNNLQRQPSFASQVSNVTVQPLQEFRNCSCLVCGILKSQCFQSFGEESQNENCVIWNQQNEEVNVNNATVIINNNNPQDSQNSKKLKYINLFLEFKVGGAISYNYEYSH
ncbi:hypothetical protein C2G38_2168589 [Gigaspora rosea]|uniref:Uncharacterized protein n=1 Tax=Gigaspora rosea TaxID=44941 RepID=A0A397VRS5_9GLOM|nr:hypothetical protein C2G38_2168589 [Gigaspora rosea]